MIYRPPERTGDDGRPSISGELALALVAMALLAALLLQWTCIGWNGTGSRWLCPNTERLADLRAGRATVTPTSQATEWSPRAASSGATASPSRFPTFPTSQAPSPAPLTMPTDAPRTPENQSRALEARMATATSAVATMEALTRSRRSTPTAEEPTEAATRTIGASATATSTDDNGSDDGASNGTATATATPSPGPSPTDSDYPGPGSGGNDGDRATDTAYP